MSDKIENVSLVKELIKELESSPEMASKLVKSFGKITKPWQPISGNGNPVNEVPVPPGQSPKEFAEKKKAQSNNFGSTYISGYKLVTIFGDEVALILKDTPKWKVIIEGEYQTDAPFVQHSQKAEQNAKEFAEEKLRSKGFVIG